MYIKNWRNTISEKIHIDNFYLKKNCIHLAVRLQGHIHLNISKIGHGLALCYKGYEKSISYLVWKQVYCLL